MSSRDELFQIAMDLGRRERTRRAEVLAALRAEFADEVEKLQDICGHVGHEWRYSSMNFVGTHTIEICSICSKTRMVEI
jgi:hypothetical protein